MRFIRLCSCARSGAQVEMVPAEPGRWRCKQCGASEEGVRRANALVQSEWTAGGPGFRPVPRTFLGALWSRLTPSVIWRS